MAAAEVTVHKVSRVTYRRRNSSLDSGVRWLDLTVYDENDKPLLEIGLFSLSKYVDVCLEEEHD